MEKILKEATVVDVRSSAEYDHGHFPGAINIPFDQVGQRIGDFMEMKTPIVVYCKSGNRSAMAAHLLKQYGITQVYNGGGLEDIMQYAILKANEKI